MKKSILFCACLIIGYIGCGDPFSNKRTTDIYLFDTYCVDESAWSDLQKNLDGKSDTTELPIGYKYALRDMDNKIFETSIYLLKDSPMILVGMDTDHNALRFIYDPRFVDHVVDGWDSTYSLKYRLEVGERIQKYLIRYQCDEEKAISIQSMKDERMYRLKRGW